MKTILGLYRQAIMGSCNSCRGTPLFNYIAKEIRRDFALMYARVVGNGIFVESCMRCDCKTARESV